MVSSVSFGFLAVGFRVWECWGLGVAVQTRCRRSVHEVSSLFRNAGSRILSLLSMWVKNCKVFSRVYRGFLRVAASEVEGVVGYVLSIP